MANSRKSPSLNKRPGIRVVFERALGDILARVSALGDPAAGLDDAPKPLRVAIAYSGGLDSSVLLRLAAESSQLGAAALTALHIHHGLSPNADAWLAHCRMQAGALRVAFAMREVSLADCGQRGVEEAARIARYAALGDMCREHGIDLLLTAHHQDDQAETVLLQLMRGAGLPGLSGMAAFQTEHDLLGAGISLGRPMLGLSRQELEEAAVAEGLTTIEDESNASSRFRRNALRNEIAPVIERHFPGYGALIARSALHAQSANSLLVELAEIDLNTCSTGQGADALDLAPMAGLSSERIDNLLRYWLVRQGVRPPSTARLEEIREQMFDAASDMHPFFDFGEFRLHRIGMRLEMHPALGTPPDEPVQLVWQGEPIIDVPQWKGRLLFDLGGQGSDVSAQRLRESPLTLRPRAGQERLRLALNRPSKSLKALFQEAGVPPWRRQWLPLLYSGQDLVFAAGLGMDVRYLSDTGGLKLLWETYAVNRP